MSKLSPDDLARAPESCIDLPLGTNGQVSTWGAKQAGSAPPQLA